MINPLQLGLAFFPIDIWIVYIYDGFVVMVKERERESREL